ncbi:hypothetical protein BT69DRAFT_257691 [Atractiella rhizophila]|nr:hypothetical protein BT69DRAFT_257691 [Atractiella rhizophila]
MASPFDNPQMLFGGWLLGLSCSCLLTGLLTPEVYRTAVSEHNWWIKALIFALYLNCWFSNTLGFRLSWRYLVERQWPWFELESVMITCPVIAGVMSQIFFARRCHNLLQSKLTKIIFKIYAFIVISCCFTSGILFALSGPIFANGDRELKVERLHFIMRTLLCWTFLGVAMDLSLSATLILGYIRVRREFELSFRSEYIFREIAKLSLKTFSLNTLLQFISAVMILLSKDLGNWHLLASVNLSIMYAISVTYTVNSSKRVRDGLHTYTPSQVRGALEAAGENKESYSGRTDGRIVMLPL